MKGRFEEPPELIDNNGNAIIKPETRATTM